MKRLLSESRLVSVDQCKVVDPCEFAPQIVSISRTHYRTSASDICNLLTQPYLRTYAPLLGELVTAVFVVLLEAPEFLTSGSGVTQVSRSHLAAFMVEPDFPHLALSNVTGLRTCRTVVDPQLRGRGLDRPLHLERRAHCLREASEVVALGRDSI